jgi:hypothetical protein
MSKIRSSDHERRLWTAAADGTLPRSVVMCAIQMESWPSSRKRMVHLCTPARTTPTATPLAPCGPADSTRLPSMSARTGQATSEPCPISAHARLAGDPVPHSHAVADPRVLREGLHDSWFVTAAAPPDRDASGRLRCSHTVLTGPDRWSADQIIQGPRGRSARAAGVALGSAGADLSPVVARCPSRCRCRRGWSGSQHIGGADV